MHLDVVAFGLMLVGRSFSCAFLSAGLGSSGWDDESDVVELMGASHSRKLQHVGVIGICALTVSVILTGHGNAQQKSEAGWQILLCTEDETGTKRAEPFTLRFNAGRGKAQLGNEFDASINDARIDFFIPYSTTDKNEGMAFSVNRITGRYTSSFYSNTTQFSNAGTCVVAPKKKF